MMQSNHKHWSEISANPVDAKVIKHNLRQMKDRCVPAYGRYHRILKNFVENKEVLDIGCAEHDESLWNRKDWLHGKICQWAKEVHGVDILPGAVKTLVEKGYNVTCADATSDDYLGRKYDRVVVGDVIEHVDNPVRLIGFILRHLNPGGEALLRTPNPFWWSYFKRVTFAGVMAENAEHIRWVTPSCAMEIAHRAGGVLSKYSPLMRKTTPYNPLYYVAKILSGREPETFAHSYLYYIKSHQSTA